MPISGEVVLRQRVCLRSGCHLVFFICSHCDRGQRYCSLICRHQSRLQQRRNANRRHQQSPEGRLDHRDRQRAYRHRRARPRVTDQGSFSITSAASSQCGDVDAASLAVPFKSQAPLPLGQTDHRPALQLRCRFCGRAGRFIDAFAHIPRRR